MKKRALAIILFVLLAIFMVDYSEGKKIVNSAIKVIPDSYDFGKIIQGEKVNFKFKVENTGKDILTIKRVTPGCDCIEASIDKNKIPHGETAEIKATFNSEEYWGDIEKSIFVVSNDSHEPVKKVIIKGKVELLSPEIEIALKPKKWVLGDVSPRGILEKEILVKNIGEATIKILKVSSPSKLVKTSISAKEIKTQETSTITVKIKPGIHKGRISQHLHLVLDIPYIINIEDE